jgi:hypothetical protein
VKVDIIYHKRKPDTTRNIKEEFTLKNATVFGGYNLLADFIQTKKVETTLGECTKPIYLKNSSAFLRYKRYNIIQV